MKIIMNENLAFLKCNNFMKKYLFLLKTLYCLKWSFWYRLLKIKIKNYAHEAVELIKHIVRILSLFTKWGYILEYKVVVYTAMIYIQITFEISNGSSRLNLIPLLFLTYFIIIVVLDNRCLNRAYWTDLYLQLKHKAYRPNKID